MNWECDLRGSKWNVEKNKIWGIEYQQCLQFCRNNEEKHTIGEGLTDEQIDMRK